MKRNYKKNIKLFFHTELDQSFDMLISIGDGHHIESSNTDKRFWNSILGINAGRLGFWQPFKRKHR
jgi:NAD kinase